MKLGALLVRYLAGFSFVGLAVATLFFAGSVTPSLLPRHYLPQGILSGLALASGYGVGVALVAFYHLLEFRDPPPKARRLAIGIISVVVAVIFVICLRAETEWQNSIRERMALPDVENSYPWRILGIALLVGATSIAIARLLIACCRAVAHRLGSFIPRRASWVLSGVVVAATLLLLGQGVVARGLLSAADSFFLHADGLADDDVGIPTNPRASGGPGSLIEWDSIGRRGKNFVARGPTREELEGFLGRDAMEPLRVYVGLGSRETERQRAELALAELQRVGGFERSTLIVATPTGTGWLDPNGVDTVEYLLGGDCAMVTMAYSYLPSWMTILVDPRAAIESAQALFDVVYGHWTTLPADARPRLYLHGLSLGSLGAESAAELLTVFEDPIDGAVLAGPPFPSAHWSRTTADRNPGSPQWLPTFRDGRLIRFANQTQPALPDDAWGPMRYVYVQYASDPMVFFSPSVLYREPDWMRDPRGPDVSPSLRWIPIVTFLQLGFDLPMATSVPLGYGHNYAPEHYIDAWIAVVDPPGWPAPELERLKQHFRSPSNGVEEAPARD